jgi:hypothetical protein
LAFAAARQSPDDVLGTTCLLVMCDANGFAYDETEVVKNTTAPNQPVQEPDACL